ncbi:MAG TPA: helix-turn-helix domain-containing protein [Anaeromyxobacteraceae bacterium]|nr:helix-turn-helix domain-containing protein [Anaeromyxobacteraceae bacterium]
MLLRSLGTSLCIRGFLAFGEVMMTTDTKKIDENPNEPFGLWTAEDVARWAKTSRSWVYQHAAAGLIPCIKVGGLLRFEPQAVKKFFLSGGIAERKVIPINPKSPR